MDFPKKQAQRLMPLYLLEYSEKLFTNHPNPEDPWGGGSDYTAGQGITITNNEISVDTNVIATKSDLPDFTKYYYVNNVIEENGEYFTKINGSGLEYSHPWSSRSISINVKNAELEDRASIVVENTGGNKIVISDRIDVYNDGSNTGVSVEGNKVVINSHQHITSLEDGKLVYDELGQVREFNLPITNDPRTYTLATEEWVQTRGYLTNTSLDNYALKTDIPTDVSQLYNDAGYATETWVENKGYATSSQIPTNYVTTDTAQTITGLKTIGQTEGTISEVDFSGFTFKLSNKAINHPEADIKIWNASYDGYQHPTICSTKGLYVNLAKIRLGDDGSNTYGIKMPDSSTWEADRVLATTNDIPTKTSELTNDSGFITGVTWNDVTEKPTFATVATSGSYNDLTDKPNLLRIINRTEAFTFTETGTHEPPYKWGENMACTSTWICYGSVEALPQIYLQHWFSLDECYAYPQYMWQDPEGYHAVYSTELVQDNTGASGARIVLNAPQAGVTWTSVSTYPVYGKDKVNNGTITITQGGTTKGSFTVNQWQDQTIALDAAGSNYTAGNGIDITNNTISIDNTVALKSEVPSTATSTSTSTVTPTTIELVFTYEDNTTQTITLMTGATVSTSTTTTLS